ncbi:MAG: C25 family cysteine peptidase, partial [Fulvivirga sp.]|nr:C25 family cysteine peptidase [Fulvivirga sp.]
TAYLNKVKEQQEIDFDALWRKRLLHLSGGISLLELSRFRQFMDGFGDVAEGHYLGGSVKTISKESNNTVELINVADEVNAGLNLVTFFGHSAPSVIDIDIGFVTDPVLGYANKGRYPMFLINGCNAGQFFNEDILFGEDWILARDLGALGFIAHTSFGFSEKLRDYTDTFYETAYGDSTFIHKPVGDIQKETVRRFMDGKVESPVNITQAQQMLLLGDPVVPLFGADKPDFEINENNVFASSFTSEPVSAASDSFALRVIVRNFGRTVKDSIRLSAVRTLNDNTLISYDSLYPATRFSDTLTLIIDNRIENNFGNNQFLIAIDADDAVAELNEANNTVGFSLFIPLFGTKNLKPLNYAIVSDHNIELLAQATDILSDTREFLFEIDTLKTFNSGFKQSTSISSKVLAGWRPQLLPDIPENDSTVYYWRTKFAQVAPGESDEWVTSSFIFINNGPEGWSQSKFRQYDENTLAGLSRNEFNKTLEFEATSLDLFIQTFGSENEATIEDISVKLDGTEYNIANQKRCRDNTINAIAFDKNTVVPYAAIPFIFQDPRTCGRTPQVINSYRRSEMESGNDDLFDYIDAVEEGDSVVLFSIGNPQYSIWSSALKSKLEEIGASAANLSALQDGEPFILLGRKGASPGTAQEFTATATPENEQSLSISETITGIFAAGKMLSTIIGPASLWTSLYTNVNISEMPQTDEVTFDVIGIDREGNEIELLANQSAGAVDLSVIDAALFPMLRLRFETTDAVNLTAAQLDQWLVAYEGVPEGVLLPTSSFKTEEKRQEGEQFTADLIFTNISDKNFPDSLLVDYSIFNNDQRTAENLNKNIFAPGPGDSTQFSLNINTVGKAGTSDFNVFVNPRETLEQFYDNNVIDIDNYLQVIPDVINPVLDVVFDGVRILDGDIVSPSPLISIALKEENQLLNKTDTVGVNIFLKRLCEDCSFERIAFSSPNVQWFPATEEEDFRIEFKPDPLEDDIYMLRVEAEDASGNKSGTEPYLVNFEVINESTITNFYPYPNPFSTSTRFIFTLTGTEIPDEIKIQIMTVSGRIVREITQDELGPVHIGNNIS